MEAERRDFHHPYQPYDIQYEMMNALYDCIAEGQIGIFESPTGTGKSLSLICSALTWLRDFQDGLLDKQSHSPHDDEESDWVLEHSNVERRNTIIEQKQKQEERLRRIRLKEFSQRQGFERDERQAKRQRTEKQEKSIVDEADAQFLLDNYNSDLDTGPEDKKSAISTNREGLSATSIKLMDKLGLLKTEDSEQDNLEVDETKIFYCSRTHSQLTQFVHEVRRVKLRPALWHSGMSKSEALEKRNDIFIKHLPLGSRKNLCINPKVSKLGNAAAINERCLELQQHSVSEDHKCSFLPSKMNQSLVDEFKDHALAKVRDIEDLGLLGTKIGICPYYATRATIKPSEIITLPYPLLLQKSAREALEISLKGHIVIIDEAHNLIDAISNIHSVVVTQTQLERCRAQLGIYLRKFRNRLKGKNRVYVTQVVRLIDSLSAYLENIATNSKMHDGILQASDLMSGKGVDQINIYKLTRYLKESKLARKVEGYIEYTENEKSISSSKTRSSSIPVLTHLESFLQTLMNPASEGRFFYEKSETNEISVKYILLDSTNLFKSVVEESRAVILAGGTMSPMNDYVHQLFSYVDPDRLKLWSCGHVIPRDNLIVCPIAKGPTNDDFEFTYSKRNSHTIINALGSAVVNLLAVIPDGVVIFFPSYSYLDQVVLQWKKEGLGASKSIWALLSSQKPVFQETKDTLGTDDVLEEYTRSINNDKGGVLLSVIGGKLSEGINFSDRLGRGVLVVGLPFPNLQSVQWKTKVEYIEKSIIDQGGTQDGGKIAGREFSENACMRAVNQSIGRAIRHRNDFASIILLDRRYQIPRIANKLPGWIKQGMMQNSREGRFADVIDSLGAFFRSKET